MTYKAIRPVLGVAAIAGAALVLHACDAPAPLDPTSRLAFDAAPNKTLVECPTTVTLSGSATILATGGTVSAGGFRVTLPTGAVLSPTGIGLTAPAGDYLLVDLTANGQEHYQFRAPLTVTLDYSRCSRSNIEKGPLSVWLVDPATGALLSQVPGAVDDKTARTVTFQTDHFSGYAIAN